MHNRSGRLPLLLTRAFDETLDFQSFQSQLPMFVHFSACLLCHPHIHLCIWLGSMSHRSVTYHKFEGDTIGNLPMRCRSIRSLQATFIQSIMHQTLKDSILSHCLGLCLCLLVCLIGKPTEQVLLSFSSLIFQVKLLAS